MGTVTARISDDTAQRLEDLAKATSRSKSFLVGEALDAYLDSQAWQVERLREGLRQADAGQFASDEDVKQAFRRWGADVDAIDVDPLDA